jgi:hypothetical protein
MRIALAADHAGAELKAELLARWRRSGHELIDLGGDGSNPRTTTRTTPAPWRWRSSTAGRPRHPHLRQRRRRVRRRVQDAGHPGRPVPRHLLRRPGRRARRHERPGPRLARHRHRDGRFVRHGFLAAEVQRRAPPRPPRRTRSAPSKKRPRAWRSPRVVAPLARSGAQGSRTTGTPPGTSELATVVAWPGPVSFRKDTSAAIMRPPSDRHRANYEADQ